MLVLEVAMTSFSQRARRSPIICAGALLSALVATGSEALAGDRIGVAASARNRVSGRIQAQTVQITEGEGVYDREVVRTEAESSAKLVMKDSSNVNVGPNSSVTLDNFVYSADDSFQKVGVKLAKGALRFTSGASDKRAYEVKTPHATIGVRG
jgi:hypothetical protein